MPKIVPCNASKDVVDPASISPPMNDDHGVKAGGSDMVS